MSLPCRIWSNKELKKFAYRFDGYVINVSGWKDEDKSGNFYKEYFNKASKYEVSNYEGYRADGGDIKIDLSNVPTDLFGKYDVVFNHTTLEHIYDFQKAFDNLCNLTKDILILVVPFLQDRHNAPDGSYLDYWRFTDEAVKKMCQIKKMKVLYLSISDYDSEVEYDGKYIFLIASKKPEKWKSYNWS